MSAARSFTIKLSNAQELRGQEDREVKLMTATEHGSGINVEFLSWDDLRRLHEATGRFLADPARREVTR